MDEIIVCCPACGMFINANELTTEIISNGDDIKFEDTCSYCGVTRDTHEFKEANYCDCCRYIHRIEDMKELEQSLLCNDCYKKLIEHRAWALREYEMSLYEQYEQSEGDEPDDY